MSLDAGHDSKRATLSLLGIVLFVVGAALVVYGLVEFSAGFMRPSNEFFADPNRVMDEDRRSGFLGVLGFGFGAACVGIAVKLMVFARAGKILRYASAEAAPVAKDTFNYLALETREGVEDVARAVAKGAGSSREVVKVRCRACGFLETEDAKFCSGCGKEL